MINYLVPAAVVAALFVGCSDNPPTSEPDANSDSSEVLFNCGYAKDFEVRSIRLDGSGERTIIRNALIWGARAGKMVWRVYDTVGSGTFVGSTDGTNANEIEGIEICLPVISPNGSMIAYIDGCVRSWGNKLLIRPSDRGNTRVLASDAGTDMPAWSPDGSQIAFGRDDGALCVVDVATGSVRVLDSLARGKDYDRIGWMHDGQLLTYLGTESPESYDHDVYVIRTDGTGRRRLTNDPLDESQPQFTPDGSAVIFSVHDESELRLSRVPTAGGKVFDLLRVSTIHGYYGAFHQISSDGRHLLYTAMDENFQGTLYVLDLKSLSSRVVADSASRFAYWKDGMNY